jgi:hypothetical protein
MKRYQAAKPNRFLPPSDRDLWGPCRYLWGPQPSKVELVSTYNPTKIV